MPAGLRAVLAFALLLPLLVGAPAEARNGPKLVTSAPLRVRDQFLPGTGFLALEPTSADVLPKKAWQFHLIASFSNTFAQSEAVEHSLEARGDREPVTVEQLRELADSGEEVFLFDGELQRTTVAVRRGIGAGMELELAIPVISVQAGFADSMVENFHDIFGFDQEGRRGVPRDAFQAYARAGASEFYLAEDPRSSVGDVSVAAKFDLVRLYRKRRPAVGGAVPRAGKWSVAVESVLKLPTGKQERLAGTGSFDVGGQLLATRWFRRSSIHSSVGVIRHGRWDQLRVPSNVSWGGMSAYEFAMTRRATVLFQVTLAESPFDGMGVERLADDRLQATLGFKRATPDGRVIFIAATENFGSFNNTADFGLHLGIAQSFH